MYKEYFGLEEMPFSIAPDPRYLYMSEQHREALAHLVYGFNSDGGFVLLTGEVGTGKTTVCRCLLEQIPENSAIAFIVNPKLTVEELLATICDEFGIKYPHGNTSIKVFVDLLNGYLLESHEKGQKTVLIIDEAQNLSADVLEQLRLLTNLETNQVKLLQIILLGQPELREKLAQPELRQLSQRVIARYHLGSISKKELASYVSHRLTIAGVKRQLFTGPAIAKLYELSGGVPRLINVLCDRALLGAFALGKNEVTKPIVIKASREVFGGNSFLGQYKKAAVWLAAIMVPVVGVVLAATYYTKDDLNKSRKITANVPQQTTEQQATVIQPVTVIQPINVIQSPLPDKLEWPEGQPFNRSSETAFQSIFSQWGIVYQPRKNVQPCEQAKANGLQCLNDVGSLNTLRQLNSPAVLKLTDEKGKIFSAALNAFEGETAALTIGTSTKRVPVKDIESHWLGDFTLLWRAPADYHGDILPGDKGTVVRWLSERLSAMQGLQAQPRESLVYDAALVKEVKKFQLTEGLKPDGIIGPKTIIAINAAVDKEQPLLVKK
ncbi:MAG: AAA family ATPase [Nitrospirae bacterium]|nr:AAA family ATPase [Nitrospirota bacterium]